MKKEQKIHIAIGATCFLIGMLLQWIILIIATQSSYARLQWSWSHPEEMKWTIERYSLIQQASKALFFDDEMKGITIVKPQMYK